MYIARMIEGIMKVYGGEIRYHRKRNGYFRPEGVARAVVQPVRRLERSLAGEHTTPVGDLDGGRVIYLGPPEPELENYRFVRIEYGGTMYRVLRSERVDIAGKAVYWWGLMEPLRAEKGDA